MKLSESYIRIIIQEELSKINLEDKKEPAKNITNIINHRVKEYLDGGTCSTFEINNGECDSFAADVIEDMGGYSDNLYELSDDMIFNMMDPEFAKENWPGELIETSYGVWSKNMLDKYGYPHVELNKISDIGSHVWIYYNGKHYDAEAPNGVKNWADLPLFQKYFNQFK